MSVEGEQVDCGSCGREVSAEWRKGSDWKDSHYCARCLYGDEFYQHAIEKMDKDILKEWQRRILEESM